MNMLKPIAENLWEVNQPLALPGLRLDHRMTVVRLAGGNLWIHSPVAFDDDLARELRSLGEPAHLIAPSMFHDLYWSDWFQGFPNATFCAPQGFKERHPALPFQRVLLPATVEPWEDQLPKVLVGGMPKINEFVFLHKTSRTLLVADLIFNLDMNQQNLLGKLIFKLNGVYGKIACSRLFRSFIKIRPAFDDSINEILQLDFDRLIPGHGAIVRQGAKEVLRLLFRRSG